MTSFKRFVRNVRALFSIDLHRILWRLTMMEKGIRGISELAQATRSEADDLWPERAPHAEINAHEFKAYSQNGEDGILLWIFSKIGTGSKSVVEFGMGSGRECISANLILNFGWSGLLMDGSEDNVADGKMFFKTLMPWEAYAKLDIRKEFITRENIEGLIASRKDKAEPDLLSIDIDGNDYWVWEAITSIAPRVAVIEYNSTFGLDPVTVPYKADFDAYAEHPLGLYHGASVSALEKLGKKKGYAFIGCDSRGANAFFVREDLAGVFGPVSPERAFYENQHKLKRGTRDVQFEIIKDKPLVSV